MLGIRSNTDKRPLLAKLQLYPTDTPIVKSRPQHSTTSTMFVSSPVSLCYVPTPACRYCAPRDVRAVLSPATTDAAAALACNTVSVVIMPDVNPLEIHYLLRNANGDTILSGQYNSNSTVYCGAAGEQLTAVFSDRGGDGYAGNVRGRFSLHILKLTYPVLLSLATGTAANTAAAPTTSC